MRILTERDQVDRIIAGQVLANEVRIIISEDLMNYKRVALLRDNAVEGATSGYSLIRNCDLNELVEHYRRKYMAPIMLLPQAQPL